MHGRSKQSNEFQGKRTQLDYKANKNTYSSQLPNKYKEKFARSFYKNNNNENKINIKERDKDKTANTSMMKLKKNLKCKNYDKIYKTNMSKNSKLSQSSIALKGKGHSSLIKNLDDKFKSIEACIIDPKYENVIDHDEIIISSNKKFNGQRNIEIRTSKISNGNQNNLDNTNTPSSRVSLNSNFFYKTNISDFNSNYTENNYNNKNNNSNNNTNHIHYKNKSVNNEKNKNSYNINNDINYNNDNNNFNVENTVCIHINPPDLSPKYEQYGNIEDENSSKFLELYGDFKLMYTDDYSRKLADNMIKLETQFFIDKILELQEGLHCDFFLTNCKYIESKVMLKFYSDAFKYLQKKMFILMKLKSNLNYHENTQLVLRNNDVKYYNIWMEMFRKEDKILRKCLREEEDKKEILKQIFKIKVFNKYNYMKRYLNIVENKIVENLMKKYKYKNNNNLINNKLDSNNAKLISKQNTHKAKLNNSGDNMKIINKTYSNYKAVPGNFKGSNNSNKNRSNTNNINLGNNNINNTNSNIKGSNIKNKNKINKY